MFLASQVSARRPWKRTTASEGEVTATIGGSAVLVCGSSTITNGIWYFSRKLIVRSAFFSLNQVLLRNSTARPMSPSRSFASTMASRLSLGGKNQRGYWRERSEASGVGRGG